MKLIRDFFVARFARGGVRRPRRITVPLPRVADTVVVDAARAVRLTDFHRSMPLRPALHEPPSSR